MGGGTRRQVWLGRAYKFLLISGPDGPDNEARSQSHFTCIVILTSDVGQYIVTQYNIFLLVSILSLYFNLYLYFIFVFCLSGE